MTLPMSRSDGPDQMPGWADVRALASYAESSGLDALWICDHLLSEPEGQPPEGVLEAWTILSALGVDELIIVPEPRTQRSVDRLVHALALRTA